MNIVEHNPDGFGIVICRGCKTNHRCNWEIDGQFFCGDCADKKQIEAGIIKDEAPVEELVLNNQPRSIPEEDNIPIPTMFGLEPNKIVEITIGFLDTGYVASIDGKNHVFAEWHKLIDYIELLEPEVDDA